MRTNVMAALVAFGVTAASIVGQELTVNCTAVVSSSPSETTQATIDGQPLTVGAAVPAGSRIETNHATRVGLDLFWDQTAAAVVLVETDSRLIVGPDGGPARRLRLEQGSVIVRYATVDDVRLIVEFSRSSVRLRRGTLSVRIAEGSTTVVVEDGQAEIAEPAPPPTAPADRQWTLLPDGKGNNQAIVAAMALRLSASPTGADELRARIDSLHAARLRAAGFGWLKRASAGDIVPIQAPGLDVEALAQRLAPRVATIGSRASVTQPSNVVAVSSPQLGLAQTSQGVLERLFGSGEPSSIVVGVRLTQVPIIGGGPTGIRANPHFRLPFGFSGRR